MPADPANFSRHFLIAMPDMVDPNFAHSITYICEHNDDGAMGIVVNRPMELTVADILNHLQIKDLHDTHRSPVRLPSFLKSIPGDR